MKKGSSFEHMQTLTDEIQVVERKLTLSQAEMDTEQWLYGYIEVRGGVQRCLDIYRQQAAARTSAGQTSRQSLAKTRAHVGQHMTGKHRSAQWHLESHFLLNFPGHWWRLLYSYENHRCNLTLLELTSHHRKHSHVFSNAPFTFVLTFTDTDPGQYMKVPFILHWCTPINKTPHYAGIFQPVQHHTVT